MKAAKENNFFHNVRKYLREYNEVTGIHGLRYLTEKRSTVEKIVWAIILSLTLAGCIYMMYEIVMKYENSPVVVSFSTKDTPIYEIPFPAVTICSELKPEPIMMCEFMGKSYYTDGECSEILTPVVTDEGVCYSFNIMDKTEIFRDHVSQNFDGESGYMKGAGVETYPRRAPMSGADNSLNIIFGYLLPDTDYMCSEFQQGFRISVHNPMDVPRLSKHYFRVPLNKAVVVAVQPELVITSDAVKKFRAEKRKCYLNSERPPKHFKIYTQSNCLLECLTNYTLRMCGCANLKLKNSKIKYLERLERMKLIVIASLLAQN
ncbi:ASC domain containing protein [Asbolus verrucosus]|uniref:ASC domain containing protein n=1 Tax=Asbolus verrucosus TaxID=1661398 RepID=A0A482VXD2_ASBVE|nr:ASC domain containing protein [Asbolus verrucosus]